MGIAVFLFLPRARARSLSVFVIEKDLFRSNVDEGQRRIRRKEEEEKERSNRNEKWNQTSEDGKAETKSFPQSPG